MTPTQKSCIHPLCVQGGSHSRADDGDGAGPPAARHEGRLADEVALPEGRGWDTRQKQQASSSQQAFRLEPDR